MLAIILPVILLMFGLWGPPQLWKTIREVIQGPKKHHDYFSVEHAAYSYAQYRTLALAEVTAMRNSYVKLSRAHKRIGYDLGYPAKLRTLEELTALNAHVTDAIADLAHSEHPGLAEAASGDLGRVRETLKHFVRDWSTEGAAERAAILTPVLDVLRRVPPARRAEMRVLVPGAGLGRLAWEISELGFDTTANELSAFMTRALRFLLAPHTTARAEQHTLHPYAYWFSHQRSSAALFRGVRFPDVLPRLGPRLRLAEGDFLAHRGAYDVLATLFFVDTAINAIATLEHIYALLRPGGTWINLGPLLWPGGAQARVELSLDEVLRLAEMVGFEIEGEGGRPVEAEALRRRSVRCEYTGDSQAMMKYMYDAEFWVARKPV
ncbi:N2227-domain-containing protein [Phanerochaete sordida]|uniref:N2227-domain-containing protein n=1 Tax=Phanerochaete sordida TaxID=48140 RepID=A0A9P3GRT6_9APHY|nr:N2227-domain-containing protein [Phanerochaete sordida]